MSTQAAGDAKIAVLSGGVGGAKLVLGLSHVAAPERLVVVANTGDDFHHLGLHIAPDIDSVVYAVADLADQERGWGRAGETWTFMEAMAGLGGESWFNLGDGDLAMHVERTRRLADGETLTEVTASLCQALGVKIRILPMTDDQVETIVDTPGGPLAFQHYFVRDRCAPKVTGFRFLGIADATPNRSLMRDLESGEISSVLIAPSNPFVSVDPILELPGLRAALRSVAGPKLAVSPIVGGEAIKGPAAKMMGELGVPASAAGVARHYAEFIDAMVIDTVDRAQEAEIRAMGMEVLVTQTVMRSLDDRKALADTCLEFIADLGSR
jgi:LPPG:FO 2-phospho-L-lactate transferase